jgi:DNA-binding IclR family transcriptional regulator
MKRDASQANRFPYRIQVLDRAMAILELLWQQGRELNAQQISAHIGVNKSTVRRLLKALAYHRLLEEDERTGQYRLGMKLFELGSSVVARLDIRARARPYLERLVLETGETAHLCILDRGEVLYLDKHEPMRTMRIPSEVGRRNPAYCTAVGKALLAYLPEEELEELVRRQGLRAYTPRTITTLAELKQELARVRERGYAVDDEEFEEGLKCIGAPVRDYSGRVVASISIAGPAFRLTEEKIPILAQSVMAVARELSEELGYRAAEEAMIFFDEVAS